MDPASSADDGIEYELISVFEKARLHIFVGRKRALSFPSALTFLRSERKA